MTIRSAIEILNDDNNDTTKIKLIKTGQDQQVTL